MRFVIVCFVFLALAFYQMSGGADFVPRSADRQALADTGADTRPKPAVTRARPPARAPVSAAAATRGAPAAPPAASRVEADTSAILAASVLIRPDTTLETPEITLASLQENPALFAAPVRRPATQDTATRATTASASQAAVPEPAPSDVRRVNGNRVNLRSGPGTTFAVLASLVRDTPVEVLADPGDGWVQLRPLAGGPTGWMADYLLTN